MAPIDHSELRFDGAFAKAASGYKDGWHDDWRGMPPPSYRLPCLSRPTTQRLQSRPIPGRLAAATTEKTCILGEKFLMSPQSELTISNS
ncbi:hypothetical protein PC129_g21670 [Phytophthora cactorum]|uniref:Uncharacterized protein n=1 Tax=Phytophthora cactorum TaxID=29920 RepID=A0A8T1CMS3_9STRA|nr:hypothetical protein PC117_g15040 [Phytophthora cactorum]KAG3206720.1 hypothetical protein PC129_g21670 [Phytophthora cactorum]